MVRGLLIRGMLVGVLAGVAAYCFAKIFGEPSVDLAIAFEAKMYAAMNMPDEPELVSRAVQSTWGLLTGAVLYGAALGGLFALVFAYAYGRMGKLGPRATSALLALMGFVAIVLVPDLKYPANPPSVGHPDTIGFRTEWFFLMIVISIAAMTLALSARKALAANHGPWNAAIAAGVLFVVFIAVAQLLLPAINEVPADFPAAVLWQFRLANLGIHMVVWTVLGLGFGVLAERVLLGGSRSDRYASGLASR
ncbi:MAG TPA: CbtA family protein [Dongiaceae bacterium]